MNQKPLISIVMNCFNGEAFLKEAIDSVISQSYDNWELIFWDNQSTDDSELIVKKYLDPRIRYFKSKEHTLLGTARNEALNLADGKWVAFLDVDDLWSEKKLEHQIDIILNSNDDIGFVYGRCELIFSDPNKSNKIFKADESLPSGEIFNQLLYENFVPFVSAIIDKEKFVALGGFDNNLMHSTDYFMFLKLSEKYPVSVLQDVCCKYRLHEGNLTNSLRAQGELESIAIVSSFLPKKEAQDALRYHQAGLGIAYLRELKFFKALNILLKQGVFFRFIMRITSAIKSRTGTFKL